MIIDNRLSECLETLGIALNPVDPSEVFEFEGQKIQLAQFVPLLMRHLKKIILKNPDKAEEFLEYIADAIFYVRGIIDESPKVIIYTSENEKKIRESGYTEAKFKVKT